MTCTPASYLVSNMLVLEVTITCDSGKPCGASVKCLCQARVFTTQADTHEVVLQPRLPAGWGSQPPTTVVCERYYCPKHAPEYR